MKIDTYSFIAILDALPVEIDRLLHLSCDTGHIFKPIFVEKLAGLRCTIYAKRRNATHRQEYLCVT